VSAPGRRAAAFLAALAIVNLGLTVVLVRHAYVAPGGQVMDFAAFWAAARLALEGTPALAYDWALHRAVEVAGLGHDFRGWMAWHYPPTFQLVVAPLGALPFWWAMAAWVGATLGFYLWVCRRILPGAMGLLAALAAAPTVQTVVNKQNGFLLAGLLGLALLALERRPAGAGVLIGLLTVMPHLFLALPVVLAAGGRWRAVVAAAAGMLGFAGVSLAVLGAESWAAFLGSLGTTGSILASGEDRFEMYASLFGVLHFWGLGFWPALGLHAVSALAALGLAAREWARPGAAPGLRAALACYATAALATRLLNYDLHLLVIGGLFQLRHARAVGFFPHEPAVLGLALLGAFGSMLFAPGVAWALAPALTLACWLGEARRAGAARPAGYSGGMRGRPNLDTGSSH
jgi:hypothetical protein